MANLGSQTKSLEESLVNRLDPAPVIISGLENKEGEIDDLVKENANLKKTNPGTEHNV